MSCAPSVKANSDPTSSVGRKPLGIVIPRYTASAVVTANTPMVTRGKASVTRKVRS